MTEDLYHDAIVAAARRCSGRGELTASGGSATVDNPLCGDRVSIDVSLGTDGIVDVAQRVRGCLLCEAAASLICEHAPGETLARIEEVTASVERLLRDPAAAESEPLWAELSVFRPVRGYKSRHQCVLLPFEALRAAVGEAARALSSRSTGSSIHRPS